MSIISRLRAWASPYYTFAGYIGDIQDAYIDRSSVSDIYKTQPAVRTVVGYIARNAADVPLKVYSRVSDTDRVRDTDSQVAVLLSSPNDDQTIYELIERTVSDICLYGRALWAVIPDDMRDSGYQIRSVPIEWISGYGADGDLWSPGVIRLTNPHSGARIELRRDQYVLVRDYNPTDPRYGSSAVQSLRQTLRELRQAEKYRGQLWRRGSRTPVYIRRPKDVKPFAPADAERFKALWDASWGGDDAAHAGGTPLLEDGMELVANPFAPDERNVTTARSYWDLTLEQVAVVYGVPIGLLSSVGQTAASAKENNKVLYGQVLSPILTRIEQRINSCLLNIVGADDKTYVEFDLSAKTNGSYLDQASILSTSTGAPWLTRNEARARLNLPAIDGGDELVVPLNVLTGGLSSPRDTTSTSYAAMYAPKGGPTANIDYKYTIGATDATPIVHDAISQSDIDDTIGDMSVFFKKYFSRQKRVVLSKLGTKAAENPVMPSWYDISRWDSELTRDLYDAFMAIVQKYGIDMIQQLGLDTAEFDINSTQAYLQASAEAKAHSLNQGTIDAILSIINTYNMTPHDAVNRYYNDDADVRADDYARYVTHSVVGFAVAEAYKQARAAGYTARRVYKVWHTNSPNPRPGHGIDGETVPIDSVFSNGLYGPHYGDVDDNAGCTCTMSYIII